MVSKKDGFSNLRNGFARVYTRNREVHVMLDRDSDYATDIRGPITTSLRIALLYLTH